MEDSQLAFIKELDALKIERAMLLEKTQPYLNLVNATSFTTLHHHQQQQQQHTTSNHENTSEYPLFPSLPSSSYHHHDDGDDVGDGNIVNNHEHHYQLSQQRSYVYKRVINPTLLQLKSKIMDETTNNTTTAIDHVALNLSSTLNVDDKNDSKSSSSSSSSSSERSRAMDLLNVFEKALSAMDQYYIVSNDEIINSSSNSKDDDHHDASAAGTSNSRGDCGIVIRASVHDNNKNNKTNNIETSTGSGGGDISSSPLSHGNTMLLELVTILAAYVQDEADT
jgi:hypothetical protein